MPPKKLPGVNISDASAAEFFDSSVAVADLNPKKLFHYSRGKPEDWKKTIVWADIKKHKHVISDLLDHTRGRQLKQKLMTKQLSVWLRTKDQAWSMNDCDAAVFNLRAMLAHLRDVKRDNGAPPRQHEQLKSLLTKVIVDAIPTQPEPAQDSESDSDVQEVAPKPQKEVDLVAVSSEDEPPHEEPFDWDEFDKEFFATPDKGATATPQVSPAPDKPLEPKPEEQKTSPAEVSTEPSPAKPDLSLNGLLAGIEFLPPIAPKQWTAQINEPKKNKESLKRPAAAKGKRGRPKKTKKEEDEGDEKVGDKGEETGKDEEEEQGLNKIIGLYDPSVVDAPNAVIAKRVHSKAYHDEANRCRSLGMKKKEVSKRAGRVATKTVDQWRSKYGVGA